MIQYDESHKYSNTKNLNTNKALGNQTLLNQSGTKPLQLKLEWNGNDNIYWKSGRVEKHVIYNSRSFPPNTTLHHIIPCEQINLLWNSYIDAGCLLNCLTDLGGLYLKYINNSEDIFMPKWESSVLEIIRISDEENFENFISEPGNKEIKENALGMMEWFPGNLVLGPIPEKRVPGHDKFYDQEAASIACLYGHICLRDLLEGDKHPLDLPSVNQHYISLIGDEMSKEDEPFLFMSPTEDRSMRTVVKVKPQNIKLLECLKKLLQQKTPHIKALQIMEDKVSKIVPVDAFPVESGYYEDFMQAKSQLDKLLEQHRRLTPVEEHLGAPVEASTDI